MNTLDVFLLLSLVAAAAGGYRLGFLARVTSWIGMLVGAVIAARFLPSLVDALGEYTPTQRLVIVLGVLLGAAFTGQGLGLLVGRRLRVALPLGGARQADRAAGLAAGVLGVVATVWFLLPVMADVPGWFAVQSRTSAIGGWVSDRLPDPPDTMSTLRRLVGDADFPRVFDALQPAPDLGAPPAASGLDEATAARVAASTLKVEGEACRRIQDGTGWVVAPDLIVTNAHVVAGEDRTEVIRDDGRRVDAEVVAFDPNRDLAVLHAPGVGRPALPRHAAKVGDKGAVFGHPRGGPLREAPFEVGRTVQATGTDIYDDARTERAVLILAAALQPGDSGSALSDAGGQVVGVAFAIAPDKPGVAYALAISELDAVLGGDLSRAVDTGPCLR